MAGTPPRKFAEKIRALEERGEKGEKEFNDIIKEMKSFKHGMANRHNASHLTTMSQPYRGRSLPNVNQMAQGPVPMQIPVTPGIQDGVHHQPGIANYLDRQRSIGDPYHGYSPHLEYRDINDSGQMISRNGSELLSPPPDSNNSWRRAVSDSDIRRTVEPLNGMLTTIPRKDQLIQNNAQIKIEPHTPNLKVEINNVPIPTQPDFAGGRSLPDLTVFEYPPFPHKSDESDGNFSSPYSTSPQASPYPASPSHSPTMIGDVGQMQQQQQPPPHRGSSPGPAPSPSSIRRRNKRIIHLPSHLVPVGGRSHPAQGILPDHPDAFQHQPPQLAYAPQISWNDPASPVRHTCRHNSPAHLNAGIRGLSLSNSNGPLPTTYRSSSRAESPDARTCQSAPQSPVSTTVSSPHSPFSPQDIAYYQTPQQTPTTTHAPVQYETYQTTTTTLPPLNQEKSENGAPGSISDGYYTAGSGESPVRFDTPQTPLTPSVVPDITFSDYSMALGMLGSVGMDSNQPPLCDPSEPSTDLMRDLSSAITVDDDSLFTGELATLGPVELEILEGGLPVSDSSTEDQFRLEKC